MSDVVKVLEAQLARRRFAFAACLALAVVAYLPVLHGYYLHTDDYFWSRNAGFTAHQIFTFMVMVGRPIGGLLFWLFSLWPGDLASMNLLRLLSVINLACFAYMVFRWLRIWDIAPVVALAIGIVTITLPPFQAYAAYLCTGAYGLAFSLGAVGVLMTHHAIHADEPRAARRRYAVAVAALFASAATYQPAPFILCGLFVVPLVVTDPAKLWETWKRPALRYAAVFFVAFTSYYVLWRVWAHVADLASLGKYDNRAFLPTSQIPARLDWFVHGVLLEVTNFWRMTPSTTIQHVVFALAAILAAVDFDRTAFGQWLLKWATIAALCIASFLPSLLSSAPSLEYRTYGAVSTFWTLLVLVGTYRAVARFAARRFVVPAYLVLACVGVIWATKTVTDYFVTPDGIEIRKVRHELRAFRLAHPGVPVRYVHVVPATGPITLHHERHEFAEPSLRHPPNIRPIVNTALGELGITGPVQITVQDHDRWIEWGHDLKGMGLDSREVPPSPPAETVLVDMPGLMLY